MLKLVFVSLVALSGSAALAQDVPHDFRQDTPPVPGQIVEAPRDKLRLAPLPLRDVRAEALALPSNGPKGLVRESRNEGNYSPPVDR
ncbi:MAG: hypothetical protein K8F92_20240 [Hyphomicrobium sp.]|uniref:hypothetical protein n=1 Tax=Hyphomicrobium sp. TaxID=82 RepID=UPI00132C4F16|nr:hypothetical protein [Hyphomicrobium sp.]KAB2942783.1 MAG: hypothetical protein F9K20_04715 [Hyphomicrobium sp.]MBZ0211964.1 hypothetical protein [Hyphomicrobium sp.]